MKKLLSFILSAIMVLSSLSIIASGYNEGDLKFNNDGKFKIMVISDTHVTDQMYSEVTEFMNLILDEEKPDLVIFLGDNVKGYFDLATCLSVKSAIRQLIEPVASRNIPYTAVYGNHDYQTLVPKFLQTIYFNQFDSCIMEDGYTYLHRRANNYYLIKSSDGKTNKFNLWTLDSGTKNASEELMPVLNQQIEWYKRTESEISVNNNGTVPSLVFQHIPIYEVEKLFEKCDKDTDGAIKCSALENPGYYKLKDSVDGNLSSSPKVPYINSGEYDAFVECGDVKGVFFGHDHTNTYCGKTDDGIILGAVPTSGFQSSGTHELRGVRIIELDENNTDNINTYCRYYSEYQNASWSGGNWPEQKKDYDLNLRFSVMWSYLFPFINK